MILFANFLLNRILKTFEKKNKHIVFISKFIPRKKIERYFPNHVSERSPNELV